MPIRALDVVGPLVVQQLSADVVERFLCCRRSCCCRLLGDEAEALGAGDLGIGAQPLPATEPVAVTGELAERRGEDGQPGQDCGNGGTSLASPGCEGGLRENTLEPGPGQGNAAQHCHGQDQPINPAEQAEGAYLLSDCCLVLSLEQRIAGDELVGRQHAGDGRRDEIFPTRCRCVAQAAS